MPLTGDGQVNKKAFRIAINSRQLARFHPLDREKTEEEVPGGIRPVERRDDRYRSGA
jgi:hypothetical protein